MQGVFSVTFPHCNVFLVARLEKVLQGGISETADPYIKCDSAKVRHNACRPGHHRLLNGLSNGTTLFSFDVLHVLVFTGHSEIGTADAVCVCPIGSVQDALCVGCQVREFYRDTTNLKCRFVARPLFDSKEELDTTAEFSPFYRQDREKLTDEDMVKILFDYRRWVTWRLSHDIYQPITLLIQSAQAQVASDPRRTSDRGGPTIWRPSKVWVPPPHTHSTPSHPYRHTGPLPHTSQATVRDDVPS